MSRSRIAISIWVTVATLLVGQAAVFVAANIGYGLAWRGASWFVPATAGAHLALALLLTRLRHLFVIVNTDTELSRVNLANVLSMIRVSSAPTLLWLILLAGDTRIVPLLVALTAIVFLTDLADGQVARGMGQVTEIGKYLDSTSDYITLFIISAALIAHGLVPLWFFIVVAIRFVVHAAGQAAIFLRQGGQIESRSSFLGKASVFATMFVYAISLLQLVPKLGEWFDVTLKVIDYVCAAVIVVSLVEKMYLFVGEWRSAKRPRPSSELASGSDTRDS